MRTLGRRPLDITKQEGRSGHSTTTPVRPDGLAAGDHPALEVRDLTAGYGELAAIRDISFHVSPGEIVALFGPNGAGKTTTLMVAAGALPCHRGEIRWNGVPTHAPLHQRARAGLAFVPEERGVIRCLTVQANLELGRGGVEEALSHFEELRGLLKRKAGLLSGGEQQMLVLGRALASEPKVLLVDELSLGLAPLVVDRLLASLRKAADERDVGIVLVEQQARRVLGVADRWYLFNRGRIAAVGDSSTGDDEFEALYLQHLVGTDTTPSPTYTVRGGHQPVASESDEVTAQPPSDEGKIDENEGRHPVGDTHPLEHRGGGNRRP